MMLRIKEDINHQFTSQKAEFYRHTNRLGEHHQRLDQTIEDAKYWVEKFTEQYKNYQTDVAVLKTETSTRLNNAFHELGRRPIVGDIKKNFTRLNDMLKVKFR